MARYLRVTVDHVYSENSDYSSPLPGPERFVWESDDSDVVGHAVLGVPKNLSIAWRPHEDIKRLDMLIVRNAGTVALELWHKAYGDATASRLKILAGKTVALPYIDDLIALYELNVGNGVAHIIYAGSR